MSSTQVRWNLTCRVNQERASVGADEACGNVRGEVCGQPLSQPRHVPEVGKGLFQVEEVGSDADSHVAGEAPEGDRGNRLDAIAKLFGRIEEREAGTQTDDAAQGAKALQVLRR